MDARVTYRDKVKESMTWLGKQKKTVFLGEGVVNAGRIYGTLDGVPKRKCLEMPICENLIVGMAIGLAVEGWKPIVVFQRMDFMLIAADAIINHLALMPQFSGGCLQLPVIIRAIIGSRDKKFWVGEQHNHDFTHVFKPYLETYRVGIGVPTIKDYYADAYNRNQPVLIVEERDLYDTL